MKDSEITTPTDGAPQNDFEEVSSSQNKPKRKAKKLAQPQVNVIDNRSFLALIIRSFVSFMVITAIAVVIIVMLAIWASGRDEINLSIRTVANYQTELQDGKYSLIPVRRICGEEGWLSIVDENGTFVYSSDDAVRHYSLAELECIQNYDDGTTITMRSFDLPNGQQNHLVSATYGENEYYMLLDQELRVISSNMPFDKTQFTQNELYLLTYNSRMDGYRIIEKLRFTHDGQTFYAVYHDTNNNEGVTPYLFYVIVVIGIICLLIGSLIIYIRYINKHVQRPLKALGAAMAEFAQNGHRDKLNYIGSKEFEQLVDSFNQMVSLLDASEEQRQALEQDRQRMLAGLSHDLKTPITIIQGFSKAIRDGLVSEEDKQKYLNLIITKSENMGTLINEFYEYSKLDHPDFKLSVKDVDVAELVRTYLAGRYDEFEIAGYSLDADITEEKLIVKADAPQLNRVFENLTNNFFKYTPQGSTLYIRLSRRENEIYIIFADNGNGINPSGDDIFAPFVVGEQSRNKQGTGLGLAVCQKIITAHGGTIALSKSPIDGCTTQFDILLPLSE